MPSFGCCYILYSNCIFIILISNSELKLFKEVPEKMTIGYHKYRAYSLYFFTFVAHSNHFTPGCREGAQYPVFLLSAHCSNLHALFHTWLRTCFTCFKFVYYLNQFKIITIIVDLIRVKGLIWYRAVAFHGFIRHQCDLFLNVGRVW